MTIAAFLALITTIVPVPGAGPTPQQDEPSIVLAWARGYFAEVDSLSELDGGALWGVSLAGPMLFVDRTTRFVVANRADSAGMLAEQDGVWVGTLPEDVGIANTAVQWGGIRWTMLMWPVPSQAYPRRQLLLHESFHRIQPELGFAMVNPANAHLATLDGRVLTRLEWRALAEALVTTGEARRRAVEDAIAFRVERYAQFPDAPAEERALERNEGLAEYTGLRLSGMPEAARAYSAAEALWRREGTANLSRSFAYATGPAYGMLLDDADPDWRDQLADGRGLDDLLGLAHGIMRTDGTPMAVRIARYDGDRVIVEEGQAAERAARERARLRAALVDGPVLRLPVGSEFRYTFDPNLVIPLEGSGTVYAGAQVRDEWGLLTVEFGGVLMQREGQSITGVAVPLSTGAGAAIPAGEGWRLDLAEGWELRRGEREGDWVVARQP